MDPTLNHSLSQSLDEIKQAAFALSNPEPLFHKICDDIHKVIPFDFIAVQLIRSDHHIIETVYGKVFRETERDWSGISRHHLETAENLRDIQADVALSVPPRLEMIAGWYEKFDRWIYDYFNHHNLVRVWVPIVLLRDHDGAIFDDQLVQWEPSILYDALVSDVKEKRPGYRIAISMNLARLKHGSDRPKLDIIGTIEAGYVLPDVDVSAQKDAISKADATRLFSMVAQWAPHLRKTSLPYVLEVIADQAKHVMYADLASIHFNLGPKPLHFCSGIYSSRLSQTLTCALAELGKKAIDEKRSEFEGEELLRINYPEAYAAGFRSVAAFPLLIGDKTGILYLYFVDVRTLTIIQVESVQRLANQGVDAIQHATNYTQLRRDAQTMADLYLLSQSMASKLEDEDMLSHIAGNTINILAADVVTIYEYFQKENRFRGEPAIAGRLTTYWEKETGIGKCAPSVLLVKHGQNIYASSASDSPILNSRDPGCLQQTQQPFVVRENIASTAGILLQLSGETVGVMFVNYRASHEFTRDDRKTISIVASAAAVSIKARRSYQQVSNNLERRKKELRALRAVDQMIVSEVTSLRQVLDLILEKALEITEAHTGAIMWYRRRNNCLTLETERGFPTEQKSLRLGLGEGIIGRAAQQKRSILVSDVMAEEWATLYKPVISGTRSLLVVPLVDETGLLGVVNVQHREPGFFTIDDESLLGTFTLQAIIAVHGVDLYRKLERQINPLRSLSVLASRIQDVTYDSNTILRLLLTGVTAGQGLGFSRAMLYLYDDKQILRGRMAIGARTKEQAEKAWKELDEYAQSVKSEGRDVFTALLDRAEQVESAQIGRNGSGYALNEAVKQITLSRSEHEGALLECITTMRTVVVKHNQCDPFRTIMEQATGMPDDGHVFACAPLIGKGQLLGVLVVDKSFLDDDQDSDIDVNSLEAYAGVVAMAIDNMRLAMRVAEEQKLANWKSIINGVGHMVRGRLNIISGWVTRAKVTLLEDQNVGNALSEDKMREIEYLFGQLADSVEGANKVVQELRSFALPQLTTFREVNVVNLLTSVVKGQMEPSMGFPIQVNIRAGTVTVRGDPNKLSDVFIELIQNAGKSMKGTDDDREAKMEVDLNCEAFVAVKRRMVRIDFRDSGPGIAEEDKKRVFEPLFRKLEGGSGMGLAMVKSILSAHDGTIEETGVLGEGAIFVIRLPILSCKD